MAVTTNAGPGAGRTRPAPPPAAARQQAIPIRQRPPRRPERQLFNREQCAAHHQWIKTVKAQERVARQQWRQRKSITNPTWLANPIYRRRLDPISGAVYNRFKAFENAGIPQHQEDQINTLALAGNDPTQAFERQCRQQQHQQDEDTTTNSNNDNNNNNNSPPQSGQELPGQQYKQGQQQKPLVPSTTATSLAQQPASCSTGAAVRSSNNNTLTNNTKKARFSSYTHARLAPKRIAPSSAAYHHYKGASFVDDASQPHEWVPSRIFLARQRHTMASEQAAQERRTLKALQNGSKDVLKQMRRREKKRKSRMAAAAPRQLEALQWAHAVNDALQVSKAAREPQTQPSISNTRSMGLSMPGASYRFAAEAIPPGGVMIVTARADERRQQREQREAAAAAAASVSSGCRTNNSYSRGCGSSRRVDAAEAAAAALGAGTDASGNPKFRLSVHSAPDNHWQQSVAYVDAYNQGSLLASKRKTWAGRAAALDALPSCDGSSKATSDVAGSKLKPNFRGVRDPGPHHTESKSRWIPHDPDFDARLQLSFLPPGYARDPDQKLPILRTHWRSWN